MNRVQMADFILRPATERDFPAIRRLIHQVQINPMALDWRRFLVAVDADGRLLGCGQIKPHAKGVLELASIAVVPEYRSKGIARAIIEELISKTPRPLYLTCRAVLGNFYEKWGFRALTVEEMPPYFRRLARMADIFMRMTPGDQGLLVMELK